MGKGVKICRKRQRVTLMVRRTNRTSFFFFCRSREMGGEETQGSRICTRAFYRAALRCVQARSPAHRSCVERDAGVFEQRVDELSRARDPPAAGGGTAGGGREFDSFHGVFQQVQGLFHHEGVIRLRRRTDLLRAEVWRTIAVTDTTSGMDRIKSNKSADPRIGGALLEARSRPLT